MGANLDQKLYPGTEPRRLSVLRALHRGADLPGEVLAMKYVLVHVWSWIDCLFHWEWILASAATHMRHIVAALIVACTGGVPHMPPPVPPPPRQAQGAPGLPSQWWPGVGGVAPTGVPGSGVAPVPGLALAPLVPPGGLEAPGPGETLVVPPGRGAGMLPTRVTETPEPGTMGVLLVALGGVLAAVSRREGRTRPRQEPPIPAREPAARGDPTRTLQARSARNGSRTLQEVCLHDETEDFLI
jgi:hypothetical protein